jgi:integrase
MPGALRPPAVHPAPYDRRAHDDRCRPHVCTPLGASTIRQIHFIVNGALKRAVRWRWVATSPIRQAEPPAAPRPDPRRPTAVEAARILNEAWAGRCGLGRAGVAGHGDRDPAR